MMAGALPLQPDDDSDTDEPHAPLRPPHAAPDSAGQQIIHSGHFMVSSPHREHAPKQGYDFDTVNAQACQTYSFGKARAGHLSIDASLTKLLECMTLAYSGKLVSPKWKNFKGLKLQWRDKIRLNNAIWRAWYMQYIKMRQNPVCHFVTPLDASIYFDEHRRPEAIATEGKYWKRRIEIVVREYHKWRTYFKKRLQKHKDEDLSSLVRDDDMVTWHNSVDDRDSPVPMEEEPLLDMEMLMAEFSDTLFSTIYSHQPNPKEMAHAGNADMIQPELFPLQPNLDLMDTFESFQDIFYSNRFAAPAAPLSDLRPCTQASQPPVLPSGTLAPVNLDENLISCPGPASILPQVQEPRRGRASSVGSPATAQGPGKFNSATPIRSQQGYFPVFPPRVTLFHTSASPAVPANSRLAPQATFISPDAEKFPLCNASVITHTASATLTHNPAATTFSQNQNLILTTQQQVPCNISLQAAGAAPHSAPQQPRTYFALTKSTAGTKKKQPQKIVPAPQPETVSLVLKNAFLAPAPFQGQTQAVIVSPSPLKTDAMLAPRMTQPNVIIAPAGIAGVSGVTEFHGSILVGPAPQTQGNQKTQPAVSRIFPSPVSETLVKRERTPSQTCSTVPSPSYCQDCHNSRQGSPCASEQNLSPPRSSGKTTAVSHSGTFKNHRLKHKSAEQKRRCNIKIAFSTLNSFVSTSTKPISHAITLQKTVEYIAKLQQERAHILDETKRLREEVEELNVAINSCQQQLPATGVPVAPQRFDHMRDLFDKYVKSRTLQNWKFWVFSIVIKPLFESFNDMVSTSSLQDLYSTTLAWLEQHCSLPALRPMVLRTLRQLSTTTSILSDPSSLPEQAKQAVIRNSKSGGKT
ncbi:MLX-interacting protein isoform X2 [Ascaphus truei]|uniref:MLX-interacting protein isoform X2 n=1 Tax=Ascaphus truei TaxID=8439 RepID=UPI003F593099